MINRIEITAAAEHNKMRLEDFLLGHFESLSKMYLRDLVKFADCEVNGRHENIGFKLRPNDFIEILVDSTRGTSMRPENIALDILFEDEDLIVVNKPAGMLVHPSHRENSGTLLNALSYHLNRHREDEIKQRSDFLREHAADVTIPASPLPTLYVSPLIRPGLPHRLDKQTSGLVVVAKTARSHRRISDSFMKKRVEKRYLAVVDGIVENDEGVIEAPIGRFAELKFYAVKEDGKPSESRYWVRERYSDATLIELEPITGRTNQLRIHCELIGHPIVGDTERGGREYERLCLQAYKLGFAHPTDRRKMEFEIEAPAAFKLFQTG